MLDAIAGRDVLPAANLSGLAEFGRVPATLIIFAIAGSDTAVETEETEETAPITTPLDSVLFALADTNETDAIATARFLLIEPTAETVAVAAIVAVLDMFPETDAIAVTVDVAAITTARTKLLTPTATTDETAAIAATRENRRVAVAVTVETPIIAAAL